MVSRPLQFFLDDTGVYTVTMDTKEDRSDQLFKGQLICDCVEFANCRQRPKICCHVRWVKSHVDGDGIFRLRFGSDVPDELVDSARTSLEDHWRLITKYGQVVVL